MRADPAWWILGLGLSWAATTAQLEMDCARPQQARNVVGRLMLSEIEGAEDAHRAAMWEAFGRCPGGSLAGACRQKEQQRFEAQWERQKKAIEDKYRKMLAEFEERCRATVTDASPWEQQPSSRRLRKVQMRGGEGGGTRGVVLTQPSPRGCAPQLERPRTLSGCRPPSPSYDRVGVDDAAER
jgi:hypothetical protein